MFSKTIIAAAAASLFLGASTALPQAGQPLAPDAKFTLTALRSASEVHDAPFEAAKSSIFAKLPNQNATCQGGSADAAIFYLQDGALFLNSPSSTPQQLFADRSGMGQGKFGYTTAGSESAPTNSERTGFQLDESNDLTLNGAGFIACPNSIDGAWSVWVSAGVEQPAGNTGCVGISARAVQADAPITCTYTS
ncbi:cell wall protein PhiA [Jackrogersella minutella]|nr:cell wall protein PhiA [Jackrogersella minutella]